MAKKDHSELFKIFEDINKVITKKGNYLDKVYSNVSLPVQEKPSKSATPRKNKIAA